jgi:hypothetical protein
VNDDDCSLLTKLPQGDVDPAITAWVQKLIAAELEARGGTTGDLDVSTDGADTMSGDGVPFRYTDESGRVFEPLFLIRRSAEEERMAAVMIFEASDNHGRRPSRELQQDLADQLLSHADVRGAVLPADDMSTRTR